MGISINVNQRQDYSYLFQSMSSMSGGGGMSNLNWLSDYASIKNGSYGKLMKAYYGKSNVSSTQSASTAKKTADKKSISTASDTAKTLSGIEKSAEALKESADALLVKGSKSVFTKKSVTTKDELGLNKTTKEYDTDAIYKAVSAFADDYNNLIDKAGDSNTASIVRKTDSLVNLTQSNKKLLAKVGITVDSDNKLSIDKEAFQKADMNTVKSLFSGTGSYAYQVSAQASMIDYAANTESVRANTYTGYGTYSNSYSSGSMMDYMF